MLNLDALKPKTVAIEVLITAYGVGEHARRETVEIKMLSYHRWHEIGAMVTDPVMPETRWNGLTKSKEANPDDPDYRRDLLLASIKRNALRAAAAIEDGGTPIPGDDLEEKATWLAENLDAGVLNAIIIFLHRAAERGMAQIAARAESFQPVRGAGDADDRPASGLDAGDMAEADRPGEDGLVGVDAAAG